jgi:sensor histidine kinase YesM
MHETWLRVLEIVFYALMNAIPYHFCVLYIFRNRLRFSLPVTLSLLCFPTLLETVLHLLVIFLPLDQTFTVNLLWSLGYVLTYCLVLKAPLGKISFVLLFILNINNFNIVASKWLESLLFPTMAMERFHFTNSVTMLMTELATLIPSFFLMRRHYRPAVQQESNDFLWHYLWLVPATFYFLWHYHVHFSDATSLEIATSSHSLFFLTVVNSGAYLIYYLALRMVNETAENNALRSHNHHLALQTLQFENLQERISETRKANHDLRHHITVMQGHLQQGDYDGLQQYFRTLKAHTLTANIHHCQHYTLNMILSYFGQLATEKGIEHTIRVNVPQNVPIQDNDLAVMIGNLVENAIEACDAQTEGEKKLLICGNIQGNRLLFSIENTYSTPIRQDRSGVFLSSKHTGRGIGLESAKAIAQNHGGELKTTQKDGIFCVMVYIVL